MIIKMKNKWILKSFNHEKSNLLEKSLNYSYPVLAWLATLSVSKVSKSNLFPNAFELAPLLLVVTAVVAGY